MNERGREAVELMAKIVTGEVKPVQEYRQLPLMTMPPMQCTLREPMQSLIERLHDIEAERGVQTATISMGFPFADIHDAGVTVLVTTNNDRPLANDKADELATCLWDLRDELQPKLTTIEDAIAHIRKQSDEELVIFADGSDNPGGGAPCDGTVALHSLIKSGIEKAVVAVLYDPETAKQAHEASVGAMIQVRIGGKTDQRHGAPVIGEARVKALSDGAFVHTGPMLHGVADNLGLTAALEIGGVEVVVSSQRRQCLDQAMLRIVGIEVEERRLLVVKSAVHFRADLGPIATKIFDGDTPGIHRPDFNVFDYRKLRRPIYPLDEVADWK